MAESSGKAEGKTDAKSEAKPESGAKDTSASDAGAGDTADGSGSGASSDYSRGENQKLVTKAYRSNWDDIFGKKRRGKAKK